MNLSELISAKLDLAEHIEGEKNWKELDLSNFNE